MNSKRLILIALSVSVVIAFLCLSDSTGHTYFYLSRTGWEWGMHEDSVVGADGQLGNTGKRFCIGPFVCAHSYGRNIDTNSVLSGEITGGAKEKAATRNTAPRPQ